MKRLLCLTACLLAFPGFAQAEGLLFSLSGDNGLRAETAGGQAEATPKDAQDDETQATVTMKKPPDARDAGRKHGLCKTGADVTGFPVNFPASPYSSSVKIG